MTTDLTPSILRAIIVLMSAIGAFGIVVIFTLGLVPGFAAIAYFMCFFMAGLVAIVDL